jgi:trans-aconitate methyltransferase
VCSYQEFDVQTLEPLNRQTALRIEDLAPVWESVRGRTVLDVGCNVGLATMLSCRAGATSVLSVDVDPPALSRVRWLATRHGLPVTTKLARLNQLTPATDGAQVVLALEVLHWIVQQGTPLAEAVAQLAALASETLIVETPWSITEPSIASQTHLTADDYSMDALLEALLESFASVEVVRFCRYVGAGTLSQRVLLACRTKRDQEG